MRTNSEHCQELKTPASENVRGVDRENRPADEPRGRLGPSSLCAGEMMLADWRCEAPTPLSRLNPEVPMLQQFC
jgi:hypothetical protein